MRERVLTIKGKTPVLLIAPHGADDLNTAILTEKAAALLKCNAVINQGFQRSDFVDVDNDLANCNRVDHAKEEVVYDEFLKPIEQAKDRIFQAMTKNWVWFQDPIPDLNPIHIFHIHGCGNLIHKLANDQVDLVVGYGLGAKKDSLSCSLWRKNLFVDIATKWCGNVYEGMGGGKFAGRDSNNMNQYFVKHDEDEYVQSMQLEIPYSCRDSNNMAISFAEELANAIHEYIGHKTVYTRQPTPKFI